MDSKAINVGPLTSFNSIVYHLSKEFLLIRNDYILGKRPKFHFDLSDLKKDTISLPALAAFLATGKKLSDFVGYPIPIKMLWNPQVIAFLIDCQFIAIATKLKIFDFSETTIGAMRLHDEYLNPNTRLIYFGDIKPISNISQDNIGSEKASHKQKIIGNLRVRCANVFKGFDSKLENTIINTTLELIVNSLMHGEEVAFVALQRSSKNIIISVCDSGIGFRKSLARTYDYEHFKKLSDSEAILIGSLIQKNLHGLRLAITEVLNFDEEDIGDNINEGSVIVSSFNAEIRWQKNNWAKAIKYFDEIDIIKQNPDLNSVFGPPLKSYVDRDRIEEGYYKTYNHFLIGTRISFEILI